MDWSPSALEAVPESLDGIWGASLDLPDSFYHLIVDELAADFGLDCPECASVFDVA